MSVKSYLKRCEEFSICSQVGDCAGLVFVEPAVDRMTQFQIAVKGGAITISLSLSIFSIKGINSCKNFFVPAHVMCIFQFPAITVFLTKYFAQENHININ